MRREEFYKRKVFFIGLLVYAIIIVSLSTVVAVEIGRGAAEPQKVKEISQETSKNNKVETQNSKTNASEVKNGTVEGAKLAANITSRGALDRPDADAEVVEKQTAKSKEQGEPEKEPQSKSDKPIITNKLSKREFVDAVYYYAKISEEQTGVPAAITTAQAILESGFGKYVPVDINTKQYSYNLFGMKGTGPAGGVSVWTTEYSEAGEIRKVARFKAYNSFEESIIGHGEVLKGSKRYASLFKSKDLNVWAKGLQRAGYASAPDYAQELMGAIRQWRLE